MTKNKIILKSGYEFLDKYCDEPIQERISLYDIYYEISTKIFDYRMTNNWSQKKLAEVLGVTQAMISKLESGEYNYTIEQLWKIANKLNWKLNISFEGAQSNNYSVGYNDEKQEESTLNYYGLEAVG